LISGPWDPTGRFTYWPVRLAAGGRVLAPAPPDADAQVIDVRDLAAWIVTAAETELGGTYNAIGPVMRRDEVIDACRSDADVELVWVDGDFLAAHEVGEWMELPLWLHSPEYRAMLSVEPARALAAGLSPRPVAETAHDTLEWVRSGEAPIEPPAGLEREKEQAVLDAWLSKE
jgi:hypothetical protein